MTVNMFYKGYGLTAHQWLSVADSVHDEPGWPLSGGLQKACPYEVRTGVSELNYPLLWSIFDNKMFIFMFHMNSNQCKNGL